MNFPFSASVKRPTKVGTKYTYSVVSSTECFLQQLDADKSQLYGMTFGKSFVCYLPLSANVENSDRLTIEGIEYGVVGIKLEPYGNIAHKKAMVERS
jgi:hypothetical protein